MTPLRIRVRELRQARDWSQEELANRSGVRQATISNLETAKSQRLEVPIIERLAKALGVEPHELFETAPAKRKR